MAMRKAKGNMYDWVTHTHSHLGGECPHKCPYCYMNNTRFGRHERYTGGIRLIQHEFEVDYGKDRVIFVDNTNDLFAEEVPTEWIIEVLAHCQKFPENTYVFQTKNPFRYKYKPISNYFPPKRILGVTIETNRKTPGTAPQAIDRAEWMAFVSDPKFVTIEPILDFDVRRLFELVKLCNPSFVNIGADSKGHGLQEPTMEKVQKLIDKFNKEEIEIRQKSNLDRLR
jgi:protein gp37